MIINRIEYIRKSSESQMRKDNRRYSIRIQRKSGKSTKEENGGMDHWIA